MTKTINNVVKTITEPILGTEAQKVDEKNRFYFMLQQMQNNRWKITSIVLFLFFFIIAGINSAVDYWFNSEDRDKMLIQKVDEEDGIALSSTTSN